jgi:predicted helicase
MKTLIKPTWDSYYTYLSTLPQGNVGGMDGHEFERFCWAYYKVLGQHKNVWLSKEIPPEICTKLNLWSKGDHGVDLVLEDFQGKLTAVQCKFHRDQQSSLDWNGDKLGNLFLEGEKADYRIIFTNVSGISEYTEKFTNWEFVGFETVATIEDGFFAQILALLEEKVSEVVREPKKPRKDQLEALNAILEGFKEGDKGQLLVPCGWGKSLEALWVYEEGGFDKALILVPSLSLLKQTKNVWNANRKDLSVPYLCICSEYDIDKEAEDGTKVYKKSEDDAEIRLHSVDSRVTTDTQVVKEFLSSNQKAIVYSTYQSFHVLEKLIKGKKALGFGLTVFDEAHKTVGQKDRSFTAPLNNKFVLGKRLFQTATPKVYKEGVKTSQVLKGLQVFDMADEKVYGKPFYKMSFRQAIDFKLLAPYKIVITGLTDADLQKLVKDRTYGQTKDGSLLNFETAANHIALNKVMAEYHAKHAITFHSTINNAKAFKKDHAAISGFDGQVVHVNGEQSASERLGTMNTFKASQDAIMTNARCLTEGIDVPNIDLVMFCDPKKSKIDIVQAAGRAMRIDKNNPDKQAVILLPVYFKDVQTMDSEIDESVFKDVKAILNALQDVDEVLMAEINALKTGDGKRKVTPDSRGSSGAKEEKILEISTYIPSMQEKIITVVRESKYNNSEAHKKAIIEWILAHPLAE